MPWDDLYYPPAMENLPPVVRRKAIEIANALLAEGHDEGFAIRVAIARAKAWARRRELGRRRARRPELDPSTVDPAGLDPERAEPAARRRTESPHDLVSLVAEPIPVIKRQLRDRHRRADLDDDGSAAQP